MTAPTSRTSSLLLAAVAAAAIGAFPLAQAPTRATRPRLVVLVVVDQFRADYVASYGHQWTKGLRRLIDGGAVFTRAEYLYAATYTCAGHATISTGAWPVVHGMESNTFFDRQANRTVPCANDERATSVAFGGAAGKEHHSPRALRSRRSRRPCASRRPAARRLSRSH